MITTALALLLALQDDLVRARQLLEEAATLLQKNRKIVIVVDEKKEQNEVVTTSQKRITLQLPNLARVEALEGDWLSIQDGKQYWFLEKKKNEYGEYPLQSRPIHDVIPAQLFFGENPGNLLGSEIKVSIYKD